VLYVENCTYISFRRLTFFCKMLQVAVRWQEEFVCGGEEKEGCVRKGEEAAGKERQGVRKGEEMERKSRDVSGKGRRRQERSAKVSGKGRNGSKGASSCQERGRGSRKEGESVRKGEKVA
jgi:hypothetical protein